MCDIDFFEEARHTSINTEERQVTTTIFREPVIDPLPQRRDGTCEFKDYRGPDEVIFCWNPAMVMLIGPCCNTSTLMCHDCYMKLRSEREPLTFWQCHDPGCWQANPRPVEIHGEVAVSTPRWSARLPLRNAVLALGLTE